MADPQSHSQPSMRSNVMVARGYLTEQEVEVLMKAARQHRWGHRDATAILVAYQHGLRASELVALRWTDIDRPPRDCAFAEAKALPASVRLRPRNHWPCAGCGMKPRHRAMSLSPSTALRSVRWASSG
jgi:integrase